MTGFAYVIHFFNDEGLRRFPEMFAEHRRRAAKYPGFVSLRQLHPFAEIKPEGTFTMLEFSDEQLMLKWRASDDHKWVVEQYKRLWTKDPQVILFTSESKHS